MRETLIYTIGFGFGFFAAWAVFMSIGHLANIKTVSDDELKEELKLRLYNHKIQAHTRAEVDDWINRIRQG